MKRLKRRLSQTLRGSHTIDESLSELAEQMTVEENGLKDSGTSTLQITLPRFQHTQVQQQGGDAPRWASPGFLLEDQTDASRPGGADGS